MDSATIMLRVVQCIHSHVRTAMKLIWSTEWDKTSNIAAIAADMQHDVAGYKTQLAGRGVSNSPGLVDLAIKIVNSVLTLCLVSR